MLNNALKDYAVTKPAQMQRILTLCQHQLQPRCRDRDGKRVHRYRQARSRTISIRMCGSFSLFSFEQQGNLGTLECVSFLCTASGPSVL
ncbi:uncharacterized [Tachysurus ichikawai]